MLDGMSQDSPEEYKKFIDGQMKEMRDYEENERKQEEDKYSIRSEAYFAFCMKPAKIHTSKPGAKQEADIKLFDFGDDEQMKESFSANKDVSEPLDGPKLYLNIVHHERVLPPLTKDKDFANPDDDKDWRIIPIVFTVPLKRTNMSNIECWHFDAHVNSCVVKRMRSSK